MAANYQLRVEDKVSLDTYEVRLIKKDGVTEVPVILCTMNWCMPYVVINNS
ncbi:MAG: hypothetical protein QM751_14710 [Paludibacteraceae bacterium]